MNKTVKQFLLLITLCNVLIIFPPSNCHSFNPEVVLNSPRYHIRTYGGFGFTTLDVEHNDDISYSIGSQFLTGMDFELYQVNIGIDLGYLDLKNIFSEDINSKTDYFKSLIIFDFTLFFINYIDWIGININAGIGAFTGLSNKDCNVHFGSAISGGLVFELSDFIQFMVLGEYNIILIRNDREIGYYGTRFAINFEFKA